MQETYKKHEFNRWVGKIPWRRKWQSTQCSCLENPMDRGPRWTTVHRVTKSWTWLKWLNTHTHNMLLWNIQVIGFFMLIDRFWIQRDGNYITGHMISCKMQISCFARWCKNGEAEASALPERAKQVSLLQGVVITVCLQVHSSESPPGVSVSFSILNLQRLSFMTGS